MTVVSLAGKRSKPSRRREGRLVCSIDSSPLNNIRLCLYFVNFVFGIQGILFSKERWIGFGNQSRDPESLTESAWQGKRRPFKEEGGTSVLPFYSPPSFLFPRNHFPHCLCCLLTQVGLAVPIYWWMDFTWQRPFLLRLLLVPFCGDLVPMKGLRLLLCCLKSTQAFLHLFFFSAWEAVHS